MARKRKRKLKVKNIVICILIFITLIVGTIILIKGVPEKKKSTEKSNKAESNVTSNSNDNVVEKEFISIKIGEEVPSVLDYISSMDSSTEIKWDNLKIENDKVYYSGTYTGIIEYNGKTITIKLEVIDDQKPTISNVKDITVYVGDKVDFYKNIVIKDNSNDEITKNVTGNYNLNKVGTYNLTYEVSDKSGNKTTSSFKLIVKEKEHSNSNTNSNSSSNKTSNTPTKTDKTGTTSKGYKIEKKNGIYYINGILIANKTYGLPSTYNPGDLTSEFMTAYKKMKKDYDKAGKNFKNIPKEKYRTLSITSGYRSYSRQTTLYNNYVARDGKAAADRYSARPGHSEHQTGLAADLVEVSDNLGNTDAGKWLANNCWKYGFILRYPKGKESKTGYMYESWHFRYLGDVELAKTLYNNGSWITLEEYLGIDSKY